MQPFQNQYISIHYNRQKHTVGLFDQSGNKATINEVVTQGVDTVTKWHSDGDNISKPTFAMRTVSKCNVMFQGQKAIIQQS